MKLNNKLFKCTTKTCRRLVSIFRDSFFTKAHLKCNQILHIGYLWLSTVNHTSIKYITGLRDETITDYLRFYRELFRGCLDDEDAQIGGPNIMVGWMNPNSERENIIVATRLMV
jgi:hypothetical protein